MEVLLPVLSCDDVFVGPRLPNLMMMEGMPIRGRKRCYVYRSTYPRNTMLLMEA